MKPEEFVELELHGDADVSIAFVEGLRLASPESSPVWYSKWERIAGESWLETLREHIGAGLHVVLPRTLADRVEASLAATSVVAVEISGRRRVASAELEFEFRCYSRDEGAAIRRLVEEHLPAGVELVDYQNSEQVEDDARGAELYSPVHDYELEGRGRYRGSIPGVFEMLHRLADQSFVHAGKVHLVAVA